METSGVEEPALGQANDNTHDDGETGKDILGRFQEPARAHLSSRLAEVVNDSHDPAFDVQPDLAEVHHVRVSSGTPSAVSRQ